METVASSQEVIDLIKETGGEAYKFCYECGLCDTVCPWNRVRTLSMGKIPGLELVEMPDWRVESLCWGGGGGTI